MSLNFDLKDTKKIHLNQLLLLDKPTKKSALDVIKLIGHVQLDSIFVTARSHDLVLHTRSSSYGEGKVWEDHEKNKVFEEFAHARCLLSMEEFPYYYRKMLERRNKVPNWYKKIDNFENLIKQVLDQIEAQGEVCTRDIDLKQNMKSRWSSLEKNILDYLATRGYIMTSRRENYSTVYYKLIDQVVNKLPEEEDLPDRLEVFWYDIYKTMRIHKLIPLDRILKYMYLHRYFHIGETKYSPRKLIKEAIKQGRFEKHEIVGTSIKFYSMPNADLRVPKIENKQVKLLSPFDNALWSRKSLVEQYQFHYKFEAYTPKKDRKYGFYSLPILYGTEFVGRVDPKFHRDTSELEFRQWSWEKGFQLSSDFWDKLAQTIERFMRFHQAETVTYGGLKDKYRKLLK